MTLTPELWKQVNAALDRLEVLSADQREAELQRLRRDEPELAAEVDSLLSSHAMPPASAEHIGAEGIESDGSSKTRVRPVGFVRDLERVLSRVWQTVSIAPPTDPDAIPPDVAGCQFDGGDENVRYGGMGVVHFGIERDLRRPVAVKILRKRLADEPVLVARFRDESLIAAQLQHPGIVPVYAVGQVADGRPYCMMKLVRGETFSDVLKQRLTPLTDLIAHLTIFRRVCEALGYAHGKRIIHRDLKPGNVMVGAHDEVLLVDWGLAKKLSDRSTSEPTPESHSRAVLVDTRTGDLETKSGLGSLPYLAPEQAAGRMEEVDERSDVFGLGSILCVILTGHPPYIGPTDGAVERKALSGNIDEAYDRLDSCGSDRELIELAKRCLSHNRDQRPANASAVAGLVAAYLSGVEKRLQQAEIQRAEAEVRAEAEAKAKDAALAQAAVERRARRLGAGIVAIGSLLLVVAVGVTAYVRHLHSEREKEDAHTRKRIQTR